MKFPEEPKSYLADVGGIAGNFVNFFNGADYALEKATKGFLNVSWRFNQESKPDTGYSYHFGDFLRANGFLSDLALKFPQDTYEIFAHCDEARSRALGAQQGVKGPIGGNELDLQTAFGSLSFAPSITNHSAQFRSDFMRRKVYWEALINAFKLPTPTLN